MQTEQVIEYLGQSRLQIQLVVDQLEEVQVVFNSRFDEFSVEHDALLDRLADLIGSMVGSVSADLRASIDERLGEERAIIQERRRKIREEYLPRRRMAADELLGKAQAELAQLRAQNPQFDEREEALKTEKLELEARLGELNQSIERDSRGLGIIIRFPSIMRADRERNRVIGRLEGVNGSLRDVRNIWKHEQANAVQIQDAYEQQWQLESVAVARLQAELERLDDPVQCEDLALRRAVRNALDALDHVTPEKDDGLRADVARMVELNEKTDEYHEGLASVGGLIGLLGGIDSGLEAIGKSLEGLQGEENMHSAYLRPLEFALPQHVAAFHKQWPELAVRFASEQLIGRHPADFAADVKPLLDGPLSEARIEATFNALGTMITEATSVW